MKAKQKINEPLITRGHLAILLGCSKKTIYNLQLQGLPVIWIGALPRYQYSAVIKWLKTREGGELNDSK